MNESLLFVNALKLATPAERAAYLDAQCAGDPQRRTKIEALLKAHATDPGFLEHPDHLLGGTLDVRPSPVSPHDSASVASLAQQPGLVLGGRYKLIEEIGEGGMGTVWMAQQTEPVKRLVAIKLIKAGLDSRQVLARFEAERQALALMDHPNIAKVLDAGTTQGVGDRGSGVGEQGDHQLPTPDSRLLTPSSRPYFVMELVKGVPITQYCDQHHMTPRQRLELFVPVCQAIQHAHHKGIIHRDLKPSNVLIALYDDRPVPKVIDFGVAKATGQQLTDETLHTGFGTVVGTVEYMSPEQASFNQLDVDTRSDIYSLGVLLYELLAGSPPFGRKDLERAGMLEMLRLIREQEPSKPSIKLSTADGLPTLAANRGTEPAKLTKLVRGELDWIVMKALEKDRRRRYETANGLAADLERYLNDETVQACPPTAWYRFCKFARRNKAALATALVIALAIVATMATLAMSTFLIAREQQLTKNALQAEKNAKDDLRSDSYFHRIALAHRELTVDNNLDRALKRLDECPQDLREWEWHYLRRLCRVEPLVFSDTTEITGVAFSPDGQRLASAGGDGTVTVRSSTTGKVIQTLNAHPGFASSVAFHRDGQHLASTGGDQQVKVWDLTTGQQVFSGACTVFHNRGAGYTVAFSPDGGRLAAGNDGAVNVWSWRNDQLLHTFSGHDKKAISVAFSRDGRRLATGDWRGAVKLWDAQAGGEPLRTFAESSKTSHSACALAFSPDGRRLARASFGRRVDVWDTTTGGLLYSLPQSGLALCVAFSPDGLRLASSGEDKTVRVWDVTTGREILSLRGHTGQCGCVAFSPDGRRLASASLDGTIRVWDATPLRDREGQEALNFTEHGDEVWSVAVSPDGQKIASGGWSMPAKVWDPRTGRVSTDFSGQRRVIFCVAWELDGEQIASAGGDGGPEGATVMVWNALTGKTAFTILGGPVEFFAVAFSPDGRRLVTGSSNGDVRVWNALTGEKVGTLGTHDGLVRGVVFSKGGQHLASASSDGVINLWDANRLDEKQEARLFTNRARVHGQCLNVAFSPDARRLATGGEENTVQIWDVQTGDLLQTLRGHSGDVYTVAFSPDSDGRWLASAGEDSTVKVWDSHTGKPVRNFRGHIGLVSSVAFTPDGRRLISGSRDRTVKIWDVTQLGEVPDR